MFVREKANKITRKLFVAYAKYKLIDFLKDKLATDNAWAIRALERIYDNQTHDEKITRTTNNLNNKGFSAYDAEILSSLYESYLEYNRNLTPKQWSLLKRLIPKYAKQLFNADYFKMDVLIRHYEETL